MKTTKSSSEITPSYFIGKRGGNIVTFGSGQPDFLPPFKIFKFDPKKVFRYGEVQGDLELRKMVGEKEGLPPENIVITNGASEALDLCLSALIKPNDKVRLIKPYYYSYPQLTESHYGVPVFDGKAKVLLLNSPSNPLGKVYTKKEIESLRSEVEYVISDEIYRELVYEGTFYTPRGKDVLNINSFSKMFSLCGIRVGYVCSESAELIKKIVEIKTYKSMNTSMISQEIAKNTFSLPEKFKIKVRDMFRERRDYIYTALKDMGLEVSLPHGAFYIFPKMDDNLVIPLFEKKEVITYPGRWFGTPEHIRLCYCTDMPMIREGMKRLGEFLKS
jgi:aspartate aminotransferase